MEVSQQPTRHPPQAPLDRLRFSRRVSICTFVPVKRECIYNIIVWQFLHNPRSPPPPALLDRLLYMRPHTAINMSSYCYKCVLILLYMCPHASGTLLGRLHFSRRVSSRARRYLYFCTSKASTVVTVTHVRCAPMRVGGRLLSFHGIVWLLMPGYEGVRSARRSEV